MAYIDKISINGLERDLRDVGAARFDETQTLTDTQKQAARANVGAASVTDVTALTETVNTKADATDVTALTGRVTAAEGDIDALETAVDTKADAADVTALAAVVDNKVDTEQGVSYAGKALVVGSDGLVTLGDAGIPAAVANALLACFLKVAWVDATGQTLYDALAQALNRDAYPKITATFNQGSAPIYMDYSLDMLKQYLIVTYYESSSSAGTILDNDDYELLGELSNATSVITAKYNNVSASFQVSVTQPDFEYVAANGVLLSERSDVDVFVSDMSITEEITIDGLYISATRTSNTAYYQYRLTPATLEKSRICIKLKVLTATVGETPNVGVRSRLGNGTSGVAVGFGKNVSNVNKLYAYVGAEVRVVADMPENEWHTLVLTRNNGQTVELNGSAVLNSATYATAYANNNSLFIAPFENGTTLEVLIDSIRLYDLT